MEAQEALVINMGDDEADFIHVRGDHHPFAGFTFFEGDDIAHRIYAHLIYEGRNLPQHQFAHALFEARGTRSFADCFKQLDINHRLFSPFVVFNVVGRKYQ